MYAAFHMLMNGALVHPYSPVFFGLQVLTPALDIPSSHTQCTRIRLCLGLSQVMQVWIGERNLTGPSYFLCFCNHIRLATKLDLCRKESLHSLLDGIHSIGYLYIENKHAFHSTQLCNILAQGMVYRTLNPIGNTRVIY